ncbi:hypothetical protein JCM8795_07770 [Hydrogenobaculum acidophilum]
MPMNKILIVLFLSAGLSFALDRCDVYGVFLESCALFGQKHNFSSCGDFENELSKIVKSNAKSAKLFIDACGVACKGAVISKGLSDAGIDAFVKMCKIVK